MNALLSWLNNPNRIYADGVKLYLAHGKSQILKDFFQKNQGSFHFKKLLEELEKIASSGTPAPQTKQFTSSPSKLAIDRRKKRPLTLEEVEIRKNASYKKANWLFSRIRFQDRETRRAWALEILNLMEETHKAWGMLDHYDKTGTVPFTVDTSRQEPDLDQLSVADLIQLSKNLPTYICKGKRRLKLATDPNKIARIQNTLVKHELKLLKVNRKLNAHAL